MTGIRILGAGLSGLTAAINLAKKHFRNRLKAGVVNRYLTDNFVQIINWEKTDLSSDYSALF
jgi:2-polyprenyl-6-methoxyphenol hydroxylase-like FAD-dependent oxidoreductase